MPRIRSITVAAVAALSLAGAGCGGGDDDIPEGSDTTSTEEAPLNPQTPSGEPGIEDTPGQGDDAGDSGGDESGGVGEN